MDYTIKRIRKITNKLINSTTQNSGLNEHNVFLDLVKKSRNIINENSDNSLDRINYARDNDQKHEEERFNNYFNDLEIIPRFEELKIYRNKIFWGGTLDNMIQFAYIITPSESESGVKFNYLDNFTVNNPDNQDVIDRINDYYKIFFKYWRDNVIEK